MEANRNYVLLDSFRPSHLPSTSGLVSFLDRCATTIPVLIRMNAAGYCQCQMFSCNSSAPKMHANTGSENLIINSFDSE